MTHRSARAAEDKNSPGLPSSAHPYSRAKDNSGRKVVTVSCVGSRIDISPLFGSGVGALNSTTLNPHPSVLLEDGGRQPMAKLIRSFRSTQRPAFAPSVI